MTQFLSQESTRGGGKGECGEKFPCVPAGGLQGQQQLEEWVKGIKVWAELGWSSLGNKPVADETEEETRGGGNQVGIYRQAFQLWELRGRCGGMESSFHLCPHCPLGHFLQEAFKHPARMNKSVLRCPLNVELVVFYSKL